MQSSIMKGQLQMRFIAHTASGQAFSLNVRPVTYAEHIIPMLNNPKAHVSTYDLDMAFHHPDTIHPGASLNRAQHVANGCGVEFA